MYGGCDDSRCSVPVNNSRGNASWKRQINRAVIEAKGSGRGNGCSKRQKQRKRMVASEAVLAADAMVVARQWQQEKNYE